MGPHQANEIRALQVVLLRRMGIRDGGWLFPAAAGHEADPFSQPIPCDGPNLFGGVWCGFSGASYFPLPAAKPHGLAWKTRTSLLRFQLEINTRRYRSHPKSSVSVGRRDNLDADDTGDRREWQH